MTTRIMLTVIFVIVSSASQVHAKWQACRGDCIKTYNACITQCGAATATEPWEPVSTERLTTINDCVRSQCQHSLTTCETGCRPHKPGR
jgi:hypothetical protein